MYSIQREVGRHFAHDHPEAATSWHEEVIRKLRATEGVLIGAVLKEGEVHKPTGGLRINEGDIVAIFSLSKDVPAVELLLQVSIEFF